MSERGARPRNPRIEALRLVAILGIAVFHTFQPWFDAMVDGTWDASPALRATLGLVSLLGAYGNHVFFLISGYFLVPRAVRSAREREPWRAQARAIAHRALPILANGDRLRGDRAWRERVGGPDARRLRPRGRLARGRPRVRLGLPGNGSS